MRRDEGFRAWPVVVGVDGRSGGEDAVALAQRLCAPAMPTLVSIYAEDLVALRQPAAQRLEAAAAMLGGRAECISMADSSAARGLQRVAEQRGANLIVVGSSHRGAVGRAVLGDVSRGVLMHAPCAVAVAAGGLRDDDAPIRTIGIGFDGSPESHAALAFADRLALDLGAELVVLTVVVPPPLPGTPAHIYLADMEPYLRRQVAMAEEQLAAAVAGLRAPARPRHHAGIPGEQLERLSAEVDLLVLGSRRWGPVGRVLHGSTAHRLLHHAACSLIVTPRPA